ncbi:MAG: hypothetical protein GXP28_11945 [Planctomycetes bacterium]|nr:hypothetical protein [Planctomycetota bacterium]
MDRRPVPTVFGAATVCCDCLPKYREQLRQAIGQLRGLGGDSGDLSDRGYSLSDRG